MGNKTAVINSFTGIQVLEAYDYLKDKMKNYSPEEIRAIVWLGCAMRSMFFVNDENGVVSAGVGWPTNNPYGKVVKYVDGGSFLWVEFVCGGGSVSNLKAMASSAIERFPECTFLAFHDGRGKFGSRKRNRSSRIVVLDFNRIARKHGTVQGGQPERSNGSAEAFRWPREAHAPGGPAPMEERSVVGRDSGERDEGGPADGGSLPVDDRPDGEVCATAPGLAAAVDPGAAQA
jgi:hypothetical protein